MKITRAYLRHYRDNNQRKAYIDWSDGSRTEGQAELYHGIMIPSGVHMGALFERALREGLAIVREIW